ncbi:hypothetical protein GCG54_00015342 [Colletotrichum gloeosporioides]|uniref:Uncharacterized protein n=1 Tax=Colletotrichum gloeosporioides TaxID=474922 RepID=A0A8H4C802_COLGL|nr:uncharacterized protein GCG54_00015342 [Colletotrichum gloeosporioides]KAF3799155.1 hypothetical protein GCG54_00015342 [Colletotrichum gloeosporioides]
MKAGSATYSYGFKRPVCCKFHVEGAFSLRLGHYLATEHDGFPRAVRWLISFSVLYFGFISTRDILAEHLRRPHLFCPKEDKPPPPTARINVSLEISVTPTLPRFGESLPQLAAWAVHGTDFARRIILILEAASRTFDALDRKLGKQEQTQRKQLEYFSGGGGNSSDSKEVEEVARGCVQGAGERRSTLSRDDDPVPRDAGRDGSASRPEGESAEGVGAEDDGAAEGVAGIGGRGEGRGA